MNALPFLILGLGGLFCLLLWAARDNRVTSNGRALLGALDRLGSRKVAGEPLTLVEAAQLDVIVARFTVDTRAFARAFRQAGISVVEASERMRAFNAAYRKAGAAGLAGPKGKLP